MTQNIAPFVTATLMPVVLILIGCSLGGIWAWLPLLWMVPLTAALDGLVSRAAPDASDGAEFPGSDALLTAIAALHLLALPLVVHAVAAPGPLTVASRTGLFLGAGLWFGQVANPCAHELIHRSGRFLFRLGVTVYATLLFGHHASAHRLIHHAVAASPDDPNTARAGEGFYRFAVRAWRGSFIKGFRVERARRLGRRGPHPYVVYGAISVASLCVALTLAGWRGLLTWAALALMAQSQLLLADYVQHYGLTRTRNPDGRLEPVSDRHSWNGPHRATARMMLNAPRHSDHHSHPQRPYPALLLPTSNAAPHLPYALPVCCTLALVPPLWRRAIHPRLNAWRRHIAAP